MSTLPILGLQVCDITHNSYVGVGDLDSGFHAGLRKHFFSLAAAFCVDWKVVFWSLFSTTEEALLSTTQ